MGSNPKIMISSTVRDLPDYREKVKDACLRADMFPKMMEQLSAMKESAVEASLAMVDESDAYIGIFAHRYGYIPNGYDISITEMEYNRAVEREIPILIFIIGDDVQVLPKDIDFKNVEKLNDFKARLKISKVAGFFKNPDDLRGLVYQSIIELRENLNKDYEEEKSQGEKWAKSLHASFDIPTKPEPFIAHPYTLLQVKGLIGRKKELEILTDWITKSQFKNISIFNIVAIGGMGKSALTWHWFNNVAPQEKEWAGRIWWSFYETDATFDSFVMKTLAYVTGESEDDLKRLNTLEKQTALFQILNSEPYLIVLDGLERILIAYARQDAAFLNDDEALDEKTSNQIAGALGLPESSSQSFIGRHRLRRTVDSRIGHFLRQLSQIQKSRILVSTRLYPTDLQATNGGPTPRCSALFLEGLSDQDALDLWREYGAKGSREVMLPIFKSFDKHPLLLQLLASVVAEFRDTPGDFDAWKKANPDFDVFGLPLIKVQSHVLYFAMKGLNKEEIRTLQVIAGFRMPAGINTIRALLLKNKETSETGEGIYSNEKDLDHSLTKLEDNGLLGWDRRSNRYDLHPIVRGIVWSNLDLEKQHEIHGSFKSHFESMPQIEDYTEVESIEELRPAIELFNSLIELKLYDEAFDVYNLRLDEAFFYGFSANNLRIELLDRFFEDDEKKLPHFLSESTKAIIYNMIAQGYHHIGFPNKAISLFEQSVQISLNLDNVKHQSIYFGNISIALSFAGQLYNSEKYCKKALILSINSENYYAQLSNFYSYCILLMNKGEYENAKIITKKALVISKNKNFTLIFRWFRATLFELFYLTDEVQKFEELDDEVLKLSENYGIEKDMIRAGRILGIIAFKLENLDQAEKSLYSALKQVRGVQVVEEELQIIVAISELWLKKNDLSKARQYLEEVWERAEEGPYPLFHADALNILAQIEIADGNKEAAIDAATKAYQKAWCDGPRYAYHYGLENAKRLLKELEAEEPDMPPFDPSKFEPMPEVDIDLIGLLDGLQEEE